RGPDRAAVVVVRALRRDGAGGGRAVAAPRCRAGDGRAPAVVRPRPPAAAAGGGAPRGVAAVPAVVAPRPRGPGRAPRRRRRPRGRGRPPPRPPRRRPPRRRRPRGRRARPLLAPPGRRLRLRGGGGGDDVPRLRPQRARPHAPPPRLDGRRPRPRRHRPPDGAEGAPRLPHPPHAGPRRHAVRRGGRRGLGGLGPRLVRGRGLLPVGLAVGRERRGEVGAAGGGAGVVGAGEVDRLVRPGAGAAAVLPGRRRPREQGRGADEAGDHAEGDPRRH